MLAKCYESTEVDRELSDTHQVVKILLRCMHNFKSTEADWCYTDNIK